MMRHVMYAICSRVSPSSRPRRSLSARSPEASRGQAHGKRCQALPVGTAVSGNALQKPWNPASSSGHFPSQLAVGLLRRRLRGLGCGTRALINHLWAEQASSYKASSMLPSIRPGMPGSPGCNGSQDERPVQWYNCTVAYRVCPLPRTRCPGVSLLFWP